MLLPAYNAAGRLGAALESIERQTVRPYEVVAVDDGSTDDTATLLRERSLSCTLRVITNSENRGVAHSLAAGASACRGELILRLDCDDLWLPNHIATIQALYRENPGAGLYAARAAMIDESTGVERLSAALSDRSCRAHLMWDNPFVHSAVGFTKRMYLSAGGYRATARWEDYDLWIRLLALGELSASGSCTVRYHIGHSSASRDAYASALQSRWRLQRVAIRRFWRRHPAFGALVLLVCLPRQIALSWLAGA